MDPQNNRYIESLTLVTFTQADQRSPFIYKFLDDAYKDSNQFSVPTTQLTMF